MKVAILGDTHFGMRNDLLCFHEHYEKFYSNIFFPYLKEHGIDTIIQLGDLFDRRKYINFNTLHMCRRYFFDELQRQNIKLITLIGNHDIFWKESLSVNSTELLLGSYNNITIINKPKTITLNDTPIDIIPWICKENYEDCLHFIQNSRSELCVGHFEISGFSMYKDMPSDEGLDRKMFKKYELVLSGHYHHKSKQDNIVYAGTPGEMTWQDYDDPRGFHVLDLADRTLKFHANPYKMFHKIYYDDKKDSTSEITNMDLSMYTNTYVKVVVINKTNPYLYDVFLTNLHSVSPMDITIAEDMSEGEDELETSIEEAQDTIGILSKYIDNLNNEDFDPTKLKTIIRELYIEALNTDVT